MRLFAISDLHLSFGVDKPMDIFGPQWVGHADRMREAWDEMVRTRIPLQRAGLGSDISAMTVFLCSDQGSWTTGQSINVDGGTVVQH